MLKRAASEESEALIVTKTRTEESEALVIRNNDIMSSVVALTDPTNPHRRSGLQDFNMMLSGHEGTSPLLES